MLIIIIIVIAIIVAICVAKIKTQNKIKVKLSKRKMSKHLLEEAIFLSLLLNGPKIIDYFFSILKIKNVDDLYYNTIMYYSTILIFTYGIVKYIPNMLKEENNARIPYKPWYFIESNYLDTKLGNKKVKITVGFAEGSAKIRNVNVYSINNNQLDFIRNYTILSDGDTIYQGPLMDDIFIVSDTFNSERVFTLISKNNVLHAIDTTYRLNFSVYDLLYIAQDPMRKKEKKELILRLCKIIENSIYYMTLK